MGLPSYKRAPFEQAIRQSGSSGRDGRPEHDGRTTISLRPSWGFGPAAVFASQPRACRTRLCELLRPVGASLLSRQIPGLPDAKLLDLSGCRDSHKRFVRDRPWSLRGCPMPQVRSAWPDIHGTPRSFSRRFSPALCYAFKLAVSMDLIRKTPQ